MGTLDYIEKSLQKDGRILLAIELIDDAFDSWAAFLDWTKENKVLLEHRTGDLIRLQKY